MLLANCWIVILILYLYINFVSFEHFFLYLDIIWTFTKQTLFTLKVSRFFNCFSSSVSHGVENYFLGLWGMGISDAILYFEDKKDLVSKKRSLCSSILHV